MRLACGASEVVTPLLQQVLGHTLCVTIVRRLHTIFLQFRCDTLWTRLSRLLVNHTIRITATTGPIPRRATLHLARTATVITPRSVPNHTVTIALMTGARPRFTVGPSPTGTRAINTLYAFHFLVESGALTLLTGRLGHLLVIIRMPLVISAIN